MAIYLLHRPVRMYIVRITGWSTQAPEVLFFCAFATFVLAAVSTFFIEEPLKNLLQSKKRKNIAASKCQTKYLSKLELI